MAKATTGGYGALITTSKSAKMIKEEFGLYDLLVSAEEDVLMLFPALTTTRQTAQRGLDIFEKSL